MTSARPGNLRLSINGEIREMPGPATVAELLQRLSLRSDQVAVERNKRLVRASDHASTALADGDVIEVVTFFGGG
jgi:thiamine biosynthesis protein ThiS